MEQTTLSVVLSLVIGGLVVPIVEMVKKWKALPPATVTLLVIGLATGAAWIVAHFLAPGMTWEQLFKEALAAIGGAGIVNGGWKQVQETRNGVK